MIDIKELERKEAEIKKISSMIDRLTERGRMLKEQYNSICSELIALGVDPKNPQEKENLETEIKKLEQEMEEKLPSDVLSKYASMSIDELLNQKVIEQIDLNQPF